MATIRCFITGWNTAARLWPVVLLLYLVDAVLSLVLVAPPASQLAATFGRSAMAPDLSWPISLNLLAEVWMGFEGAAPPWALYLLVSLVSLLVGTFLRGGVLCALKGDPASFSRPAFFADCARFFPRLLLLLLFFVPGVLAILVLAVASHFALSLLPLPLLWAILARAALLGFLFFVLLTVLDYTRISLVLEPERAVPRHIVRALAFAGRHFLSVLALGLAFAAAAVAIAAVYPALLLVTGFHAPPWVGFVVAQGTAVAASWQRVATFAGEMRLYRQGSSRTW